MNPSLGFSYCLILSSCSWVPEPAWKRLALRWSRSTPACFLFAPRPHALFQFSLDHTFTIPTHPAREALSELTSFLHTLQMCLSPTPVFQLTFIGFLFLNLDYPSSFSSHPTAFPNTCTSVSLLGIPSHCWLNIWFTWLTSADKQTPPCTIYPLFLLCSLPVLPVHPLVGGIKDRPWLPTAKSKGLFLVNIIVLDLSTESTSSTLNPSHMIWLCLYTSLTSLSLFITFFLTLNVVFKKDSILKLSTLFPPCVTVLCHQV